MNQTSRAAVLTRAHTFEIREFPLPRLGPRDLLMKVALCGICGSDVSMWHGNGYLQEPWIPGHEFIGEVVQAGSREALLHHQVEIGDQVAVELLIPCHHCKWCKAGRYELCIQDDVDRDPQNGRQFGCNIPLTRQPTPLWGGFSQYLYIPADAFVHRFQPQVSWKSAVLVEPLATAQHAVDLGGLIPGDDCVIFGPGAIGLSLVMAARSRGAGKIILIGTEADANRLEVGKILGADFTITIGSGSDLKNQIKTLLNGYGPDLAFESSGSEAAQLSALRCLGKGGSCVWVGFNGKELAINPNWDIIWREIHLIGSLMSGNGYEPAMNVIQRQDFPLESLVTHVFPLDQIDEAFQIASQKKENAIKVVIDPWA